MKTTNNYVRCEQYTSTDWHDMASVVTQMKQDGHYEIDNPEEFIATDIFEHIKTYSPTLTVENIVDAMNSSTDLIVPIDETSRIAIFSKNDSGMGYQFYYDLFDYTCLKQYFIYEIETDKVTYLVSEHIVNPGKGCALIQRTYHDMFDNLLEAEKYQAKMMEHYEHSGPAYREESGFKISVEDKVVLARDAWFQKNMLAVRLMKELCEESQKYRFYNSIDYIISILQQKKYSLATNEEKQAIDTKIYRSIREYLSGAQTNILDVEVEAAQHDATISLRATADKAIILAFVNASSQIDYDLIYAKLGDYECRIAQLTEANAREKRGHSKVCVSKNGEIGYYDNAFGINSWSGAKDNPYYGKFSYNMGGVIEQFRSFENHHMFVDTLPTQELVDSYYKKYEEWEAVRLANDEPFS